MGLLGHRDPPGRAEGTGRPAQGDDGHGLDLEWEAGDLGQFVTEDQGEGGEGRAQAEGGGGQEHVLGGREDRGGQDPAVAQAGVGPHDDQDGGGGDAPLGALIDLVQQRSGEAAFRMGLGPALPGPAVQVSDGRPAVGVADDDEDPGLLVLGAGGEGGGLKDPFNQVVGQWIGREGPAGALAEDDIEEFRASGPPVDQHGRGS